VAGGSSGRLKLRWIEGRIHLERGDLARAESLLAAAREGFQSRGLDLEAAIVSLNLAALELRRRQPERARSLVGAALEIFTVLGVPRAALGTVELLRRALEGDALCEALLLRMADRLIQSREE
jgi:hypothetical protein